MKANELYYKNQMEAQQLLNEIMDALQLHADVQSDNEASYGFAGDLEHVNSQLQDIKRFLTGGVDDET